MTEILKKHSFPKDIKHARTWLTTLVSLLLAISTLFELIPYIRDKEDGDKTDEGKLNIGYSWARMICFVLLTILIFFPLWADKFKNNKSGEYIRVTGVEKVFGVLSGYYIIFYALLIGYY